MRQDLVIRQAQSYVSPHHRPPPRRVYKPTPDGFERFLRACVGLPPAAAEITLDRSCGLGRGVPLARSASRLADATDG